MREHEARSGTRGDRLGVTDTPVCERFHGQRLWSPYNVEGRTPYLRFVRHVLEGLLLMASFLRSLNLTRTQRPIIRTQ
jgi:hypothetical protein